MYIRFFDVVHKEISVPVATVQWKSLPPSGLEIVPVVFLTTDVFRNEPNIRELAGHVTAKIDRLRARLDNPVHEVQIDCDWTPSTRGKFFEFLEYVRAHYKENGILLSSTLSLHQVKYAEMTGVPPADRGMLMFYNTGRMQHYETSNSILDLDTARQFMVNFEEYPLPIDAALPVFSWGIVFCDGVHDVMHGLTHEKVESSDIFKREKAGFYRCTENGIFDDTRFYEKALRECSYFNNFVRAGR